MYKVVIADDEPPARDKLRYLVGSETDFSLVGEAAGGADAVRLAQELQPDLLILDYEMPPPNGLGVVSEVAGSGGGPLVILVTAHAEHAVEAFAANVVDYLLKPYSQARFIAALNRVRERLAARTASVEAKPVPLERLLVKTRQGYAVVSVSEIIRAEAAANYVVLHTKDGNHVLRSTLNELHEQLDQAVFFRASRSSIVNLRAVGKVLPHRAGGHELALSDGSRVRLARNLRELQEKLQTSSAAPWTA